MLDNNNNGVKDNGFFKTDYSEHKSGSSIATAREKSDGIFGTESHHKTEKEMTGGLSPILEHVRLTILQIFTVTSICLFFLIEICHQLTDIVHNT